MSTSPFPARLMRAAFATRHTEEDEARDSDQFYFLRAATTIEEGESQDEPWRWQINRQAADANMIFPNLLNEDISLTGYTQFATQTKMAFEFPRSEGQQSLTEMNLQNISYAGTTLQYRKIELSTADEGNEINTSVMLATTAPVTIFSDAATLLAIFRANVSAQLMETPNVLPSKLYIADEGFELSFASVRATTTDPMTIFADAATLLAISRANVRAQLMASSEVLPSELSSIKMAISESEWILRLPNNWDDEGGIGYSLDTLKSASSFLTDYAVEILNKEDFPLPPPRITPGPDGSIDLHWVENKYGFLINFEPEPSDAITFYGEAGDGNYIKGKLKRGEINRAILLFLMGQD